MAAYCLLLLVGEQLLLLLLDLEPVGHQWLAGYQLELLAGGVVLWVAVAVPQVAWGVGEGGCEGGWAVWPTNRPVQ